MKRLISLFLTMCILTGCSNEKITHSSSSVGIQEVVNSSDSATKSNLKVVYQESVSGDIIFTKWLKDTLFIYITSTQSGGHTTCKFFLLDVNKGVTELIYINDLKENGSPDISVSLVDTQLKIYLCDTVDTTRFYSKVVFDIEDKKIMSEHELHLDDLVLWEKMSVQDTVLSQIKGDNNHYLWVLYPLENTQHLEVVERSQYIRYREAGDIWSQSGEYFYLANDDEMGMDKFKSLTDLFAYPKSQWPTELQYDIFSKDGEYISSFTVDFKFKDNGSETNQDIYWISNDRIYIRSTFYDAALNKKQTSERILDAKGTTLFENSYDGEPRYYYKFNFVKDGVFFDEMQDDGSHLVKLSFLTGETIDYGLIEARNNSQWLFNRVSPKGNYVMLRNEDKTAFKVLKIEY